MSFSIKKVMQRLLVFFIGAPLVGVIVYCFPQRGHALANIALTLLCGVGGLELASIFRAKNIIISRVSAVFLGMLIPAAACLSAAFTLVKINLTLGALVLGVCFVLLKTLFTPIEQIEGALARFAASLAILLYPGLLLSAVIFLGGDEYSTSALLFFLTIVIGNDSAAWLFGILLGKGNRGIVPVSPNKSAAGFVGGVLSSTALGFVFSRFIPFSGWYHAPLIAFGTAAAASLGDLAESALKRSAGVKDSGRLFPGRGGVLDSLDSLALAAPVFFVLYNLFIDIM